MQTMIVDNDRWVLAGVRCLLEREMPEMELACFDNVTEALAHARKEQPAIVISDIEMPVFNGLELCRRLKKEYDPCIVIISSYEKFQYAQQAISLGVKDYVLKPVNQKEFSQLIQKLRDGILAKEDKDDRYQRVVKAKCFLDIAAGRAGSLAVEEYLRELQLAIEADAFTLSLLHVEDYSRLMGMLGMEPSAKLPYEEVLDTAMGDCPGNVRYHELQKGQVLFMVLGPPNQFEQWLQQFVQAARKSNCTATAGISLAYRQTTHLAEMYRQALGAVQRGFWEGNGKVFHYKPEAAPQEQDGPDLSVLDVYVHKISSAVSNTADPSPLHSVVHSLFSEVLAGESNQKTVSRFCERLLLLVSMSFLSVVESSASAPDILEEGRFAACKTLEQLRASFEECLEELQAIVNQTVQNKSDILKAVTDEMLLTDCASVSLDSVAEKLDLHPTYLSVLFKEKMGKNFKTYVSEYKMQYAKHLMRDPQMKIHQIATRLGYMDTAHFSKVFKKHTGLSPSDFRENDANGIPFPGGNVQEA